MSDEKDEKWVMPAPVFRSSAGSLPKSMEETVTPSFIANAETIEIDADDDILSILETPGDRHNAKMPELAAREEILEIESDGSVATDLHANENGRTSAAGHRPVSVAIKVPFENAGSVMNDSRSNLVVYAAIALAVVAIVTALIYYQP